MQKGIKTNEKMGKGIPREMSCGAKPLTKTHSHKHAHPRKS